MLAVPLPGSLGRQAPVSPPNSELAQPGGPTQDAMWISSLGLEIAVPAGWEVNNYGCGMDSRPSVVRFLGMTLACATPEPPTKDLAIIGAAPDGDYAGMTTRDVTLASVPARL